jgi:hypothetical protein
MDGTSEGTGTGTIVGRRFTITGARPEKVGMRFDQRMPFDDWRGIGERLGIHCNASAWWLGDWLAFGQYKYGRRYKMGVELTRLDYQTLRNYAAVSRRFEMSRRRDNLSFQHHAEVCALPNEEQDFWLDRAAANGWSRNMLRRAIRAARSGGESDAPTTLLRLACEDDRRERWCAAAAASECELDEWIMRTLDDAASVLLEEQIQDVETIEEAMRGVRRARAVERKELAV